MALIAACSWNVKKCFARSAVLGPIVMIGNA